MGKEDEGGKVNLNEVELAIKPSHMSQFHDTPPSLYRPASLHPSHSLQRGGLSHVHTLIKTQAYINALFLCSVKLWFGGHTSQ